MESESAILEEHHGNKHLSGQQSSKNTFRTSYKQKKKFPNTMATKILSEHGTKMLSEQHGNKSTLLTAWQQK